MASRLTNQPPGERCSIKFRFDSIEQATVWFEEIRHLALAPSSAGLRLQELTDVDGPEQDTRLIVSPDASDQHPWLVGPVGNGRP